MLIGPARFRLFASAASCVLALLWATVAGADETGQSAADSFAGVTLGGRSLIFRARPATAASPCVCSWPA
jgi:hypothetical protein